MDDNFLIKAATTDNAEIETSKLASKRSGSQPVKDFAAQVVRDHEKSADRLAKVIKNRKVAIVSRSRKKTRDEIDRLGKLQGAEFDREYLRWIVKTHKEGVSVFENQVKNGKDAEIRSFADETLPTLRAHLKRRRIGKDVAVIFDGACRHRRQRLHRAVSVGSAQFRPHPKAPVAQRGIRVMSAGKTADKKRRVLVVDDDVNGAESWAELVGLWGFDVEVAHDGPSALRAAEERVPDAILLDIGLPLLDGYEVARRLRQRLGEKPFLLALTGRAQPLDRIAAAEAGINLHFAKPTDPNEILAALKQLDHRPKHIREACRAEFAQIYRLAAFVLPQSSRIVNDWDSSCDGLLLQPNSGKSAIMSL